MQLAVVSSLLPRPENTFERTRILRLATALASAGEVHLFAQVRSEDLPELTKLCGRSFVPFSRVVTALPPKEATPPHGWFPGRRDVAPVFSPQLRDSLAHAHDARPFDAVVAFGSETVAAVHGLREAAVVLDEPVVRSRESLLSPRGASAMLAAMRERNRWRELERGAWMRADVVTVASEQDARAVAAVRPDTGQLIPYGVDTTQFRFVLPSKRKGNTVLFTGDLTKPTVRETASVLAEQVMPLVERVVKDVTLTIGGPTIPPSVRHLERDTVQVVGSVRNLIPLFEDHLVYAVAPTPSPASYQDILQAAAAGMVLVAPPADLRGTGLEEHRHFLGARTVEMTARNIIRVIRHREEFDQMARATRRVAEALDWDKISAKFVHLVMATSHRKHS